MYCQKCGEQLLNSAAFCSSCGEKIASAVTETVIKKGLCNRVKNPFFVQNGNALLTNQRFIYLKHNIAKTLAIGALVNLTKGSFDFDINLSDIESIEDGRQGVSRTIVFNTRNGQRYNFYFTNREEWKIALQNAINDSKQKL